MFFPLSQAGSHETIHPMNYAYIYIFNSVLFNLAISQCILYDCCDQLLWMAPKLGHGYVGITWDGCVVDLGELPPHRSSQPQSANGWQRLGGHREPLGALSLLLSSSGSRQGQRGQSRAAAPGPFTLSSDPATNRGGPRGPCCEKEVLFNVHCVGKRKQGSWRQARPLGLWFFS